MNSPQPIGSTLPTKTKHKPLPFGWAFFCAARAICSIAAMFVFFAVAAAARLLDDIFTTPGEHDGQEKWN